MSLSIARRIQLGVLGIVIVFGGYVAMSLEREYGGSGTAGAVERENGIVRVYEISKTQVDETDHPRKTLVFQGTEEEVDRYLAEQDGGRNYLPSAAVIIVGIVAMITAASPSNLMARAQSRSQGVLRPRS